MLSWAATEADIVSYLAFGTHEQVADHLREVVATTGVTYFSSSLTSSRPSGRPSNC
jgi:hypothetical protein